LDIKHWLWHMACWFDTRIFKKNKKN